MSLPIALVFHFNQHLNEYASIGSRTCYRGLLKILRAHPALKINIHISGTLIDALKWLDNEPLKLIREGLAEGQFELLGSTYAQNIPYASNDWDNARQIELHRSTLKDLFDVEPTVFWNPERCWRQSLVPMITAGGYTSTLIEDGILKQAGASEPLTFTTRADSAELKIITDDQTVKSQFNFAAWFGRSSQLLAYLHERARGPNAERCCVTYAEDAEALGLWEWQEGLVPNQTWAHLHRLLTELEGDSLLQLIKLSEAPAPSGELTPIPDGGASWMDMSLSRSGLPYHEDGYANWLDFNKRSPKLKHFRQTYNIIRSKMGTEPPQGEGAQRLYRAALHSFLAHQYEFGCIGVGGLNYRGWEDARAAVAIALAAKEAEAPREYIQIDDCNGDGSDEVIVSDGKQLIITSAYGGRLLYWFDLVTGRQFAGNQLPVLNLEYHGTEYAAPSPVPARWLPEDDEARDLALIDEEPPTRLGRYLPEWIWEGEPAPLKVAVAPSHPTSNWQPLSAQTRVFCDLVTLDATTNKEDPPVEWLDSRLEKNGVTFIRYLSDELTLEKSFRLGYGRMVIVTYQLRNHDTRERSFRVRITNELTPDYDDVLRGGRGSLAFIESEDAPGVVNTRTGTPVTIQSSRPWQAVEHREDFYALNLGLVFDITMGPRSEQKFELKLARGKTS
jgi:Glycosyl hydrolase family 57